VGGGSDVADDWKGDRLDPVWRRVVLLECLEHAFETVVDMAWAAQARVRGPQTGERLPHAAEGVFHGAGADWQFGWATGARAIPEGENLQDGDGVRDIGEGGIHSEVGTELDPS